MKEEAKQFTCLLQPNLFFMALHVQFLGFILTAFVPLSSG